MLLIPQSLTAQHHAGVTAVLAGTRMDPAPGGASLTEFKLEQPVLYLRGAVAAGRVRYTLTANFEGATMPDGVLTPGGFGEGYVDRRHPHTYVHEAVLGFQVEGLGARRSAVGVSLSIGKGFVAFGSEDPMMRPALRYPVNHHYAQILERAVVILGVRAGGVVLEGTLFNGDEPEEPEQFPNLDRFGDAWALRVTALPHPRVEASASYARVPSPEHRGGAGPLQTKWHAGLRVERPVGAGTAYALGEWARTTDGDGFFTFHSLLLEGAWTFGGHRPYYRFERTTRPEEERLLDPFRTLRPHLDDHITGATRFTVHTLGYGWTAAGLHGGVRLTPLAEVSLARATDVEDALFRSERFYGGRTIWTVTVGLRVGGGRITGMGRYGVKE